MTGRKSKGPGSPMDKQGDAFLGRDIQTKIGQQLRAIYDEVIDQGVPDRFVELVRQIEQKRGAKEPPRRLDPRGDKESRE